MKPTHICFYKVKMLYSTLSLIQAYKVTFLVYRYVGGGFRWRLFVRYVCVCGGGLHCRLFVKFCSHPVL